MEGKIKSGSLILKSGVMRSKQKKWCVFCTKVDEGQILEFFDNQEDAKKKSMKAKKTHALKHVKSIDTVSKSSTKDYYIDIHTKKERITLCFENENELEDWSAVFQTYVPIIAADRSSAAGLDEDEEGTVKQNMFYESSEDTVAFDARVEPTPASEKKRLDPNKTYRLLVTMTNIALEDPTRDEDQLLFRWMYEFIRSYGKCKHLFTINAGRKSETGEGEFSFHVSDPRSVEQAIELQTKRKYNIKVQQQKSEVEERENSAEDLRSSAKRPHSVPSERKSVKENEKFQEELASKLASGMKRDDSENSSSKKEQKSQKKEEKKGGFNLFGKKKDKKEKNHEKPNEGNTDKPLKVQKSLDEHIYDEAVPNVPIVPSSGGDMYSDVLKVSGNWKTHGQKQPEEHMELYQNISDAAKENKGREVMPPLPAREYEDDTYDTLAVKGGMKPQQNKPEEKGLYGIASGRRLLVSESVADDSVYDDAVSFQKVDSHPRKLTIQPSDIPCEYETVD